MVLTPESDGRLELGMVRFATTPGASAPPQRLLALLVTPVAITRWASITRGLKWGARPGQSGGVSAVLTGLALPRQTRSEQPVKRARRVRC